MKILMCLVLFLAATPSSLLLAQTKSDTLYKSAYDTSKISKMRDSVMNSYQKQYGDYQKKLNEQKSNQRGLGNGLFGVSIDLIVGAGFSKTNFDVNRDTSGLSNTGSKTGPMIGANINLRLLGFSLSTGFNYSSKGFTTTSNSYSANYFNIPLMFAFNFNVSKVQVDLAAGPYLGILLSQDQPQNYALKNIDLGITGTLQGSYFFNKFLGALLGVKYEQGGLNNLIQNNAAGGYINSIKTTNWFIYSGVKFVL